MKRRNFLSGLLAAPLALKARLARFFGRKPAELCNAPVGNHVLRLQRDLPLPKNGRALMRMMRAGSTPDYTDSVKLSRNFLSVHCSLPRGHKGPHVLLNPR